MIFKGSGVALITPFNDDLSVNFKKLEELLNFHIENKTDAIIILGTTGESATLTDEEKYKIIDFSIEVTKGKIPLIVGTGSNDTDHAIKLSSYAASRGVDGVLIVTPYYNKASQEGLYLHYEKIAKSIPNTPIILYNVPSRTGVDISIETIKKLATINNIVGIKEASTDISKIAKLQSFQIENFALYSGNDDLTLPLLSLGASGVISVFANVKPKVMHEICNLYFNGNIVESKNVFFENLELMQGLFLDVNPIPVKEALNYLGYNVGGLRLPLCNMGKNKKENLIKKIENS